MALPTTTMVLQLPDSSQGRCLEADDTEAVSAVEADSLAAGGEAAPPVAEVPREDGECLCVQIILSTKSIKKLLMYIL